MSKTLIATLANAAALAAALAATLPAHAVGKAEVNWVHPENYADAGRGTLDRERVMKTLSEFFQQLAAKLPDGQTLKLDVLDVDLAGELRPFGTQEIRVLKGRADWPHMTLHYTLQSGGRTLAEGQARLDDMNYFFGLSTQIERYGDLAYEKRMVQHWFDKTFKTP